MLVYSVVFIFRIKTEIPIRMQPVTNMLIIS